jgi:Sel1 repeat
MRVKQRQRGVDSKSVVGWGLLKWAAVLAVWAVLGGLLPGAILGAEAPGADADDDEPPPDLNVIRMKAEAGHVQSQSMLADWFAATADFTNAVVWYRKAADQGNVSAQLSLASFLITGRGTARNPQEAAKWLRLAANGIESPQRGTAGSPIATAAASTNRLTVTNVPLVISKNPVAATNLSLIATQTLSSSARVERVTTLQVPEPVLPDIRPTLAPPPDPR